MPLCDGTRDHVPQMGLGERARLGTGSSAYHLQAATVQSRLVDGLWQRPGHAAQEADRP